MTALTPRLRMFAGPNGSGKSTLKDILPPQWLGVYVNADDIEKTIRTHADLNLTDFAVTAQEAELRSFLENSLLLKNAALQATARQLRLVDDHIVFGDINANSYLASVLADFIRHKLLNSRTSFTFETVMSSPDKVAFLQKAQAQGYRTYLYFVATEDPDINVARVQYRVQMGGHPVAEDKIRSRYARSLSLLSDALAYTDRAYVFDNSGHSRVWVAEATGGVELEAKSSEIPAWFRTALWDNFEQGTP